MDLLSGRRARREFEAFVADTSAALLRTGYLMTWDRQLAEDLLQETYLRVARRWSRVRELDQPLAYCRRILTNLALDERGRRARRPEDLGWSAPESLASADQGAELSIRGVESRLDLLAALRLLPTRSRVVLVLRFWEDLSVEDTAAILGCSAGTVKSTTSRGLTMLRRLMVGDGTGPPGVGTARGMAAAGTAAGMEGVPRC